MSEVDRTELVTDELYGLDVQFISDDDKYFPFEVSFYNVCTRQSYVERLSEACKRLTGL